MTITRRQFVVTTSAIASGALPMHSAWSAMQLNLADVLPDGNFMVQNARKYAEAVAKATGGEVTINLRPGGSLGFKGPEQMRAVRDGLVPMADVLTSQQIGDEPMFGTEGIPFLVGSQAELRTELASCHAAANARPVEVAESPGAAAPSSGARKLLERQPEGIDACARMESADRAVLSNLKK